MLSRSNARRALIRRTHITANQPQMTIAMTVSDQVHLRPP